MIASPPPPISVASPNATMPATVITVNTAYFDPQSQNAIVNLRAIKGTVYIDACNGRTFHFSIVKKPGEQFASETITCKGDKEGKTIFIK
jgi:hypothetical protein